MAPRIKQAAGILVAVAAALGTYAPAAAALPRPTGSAAAVAFERAQQRVYDHVPGVRVVQRGLAVISSDAGAVPSLGLYFAGYDFEAGWTLANETETFALQHNRVVWASDVLRPVGRTRDLPVQLIINRAGAFWQPLSGVRFPCFLRYYGTEPFGVGDPFQIVTGNFQSPTYAGDEVVISGTQPFDADQTQTYVETNSTTSKLELSAVVHVSKGARSKAPAFTYTQRLTNLTRAPRQPKVTLCPN
jgi:hypothetical protein